MCSIKRNMTHSNYLEGKIVVSTNLYQHPPNPSSKVGGLWGIGFFLGVSIFECYMDFENLGKFPKSREISLNVGKFPWI